MTTPLVFARAIATARYHDRSSDESYDEAVLATAREIETYAGYAHLGFILAHQLQLFCPRYMRHRLLDVLYESEDEVAREAFRGHPSAGDARTLLELGFLRVIGRVLITVFARDTYPIAELRRLQGDLANVQARYGQLVDQLEDPPPHLRPVYSNSPLQATRSMPNLIAAQLGEQWQTHLPSHITTTTASSGTRSPRARRLSSAQSTHPLATMLCDEAIGQLTGLTVYEKGRLTGAIAHAQHRARPRSMQRTRSAETPPLLPLVMSQIAYTLTVFVAETWDALEGDRAPPQHLHGPNTTVTEVTCLARQYLTLHALCRAAGVLIDPALADAPVYLPPLMNATRALLGKARAAAHSTLAGATEMLSTQCRESAMELCMLDVLVAHSLATTADYTLAYREAHVTGDVAALDRLYRGLPERSDWVLDLRVEEGYRRYSYLADVLVLVQRIVRGAVDRLRHYVHTKKALPARLQWKRTVTPNRILMPPRPQKDPRSPVARSRHVSLGHMRERPAPVRRSAPIPVPTQQRRATRKLCTIESPPKLCWVPALRHAQQHT